MLGANSLKLRANFSGDESERSLTMRTGRIVRTILFVFAMHRVEAQVPRQSPPPCERGGAARQDGESLAPLAEAQSAVQNPGSSHAQPEVELRRFSLSSGVSIDVSP
jgi:hypothetical protein